MSLPRRTERVRPSHADRLASRVRLAGLEPPDTGVPGGWVPDLPTPSPIGSRVTRGDALGDHRSGPGAGSPAPTPAPTLSQWLSQWLARWRQRPQGQRQRRQPQQGQPQRWQWRVQPGRGGAVALVTVAVVVAGFTAVLLLRQRPAPVVAPPVAVPPVAAVAAASPSPAGVVVVDVAGKVRRPGIVRLAAGSRVADALRAAGGPLRPRDVGLLNLARVVGDGEQVLVGVGPPPGSAGTGAPTGTGAAATLDLNTATVEQLDTLPGVGPVLAQRILDYRTRVGRFTGVGQLQEVSGIGPAKYADLRGRVRVG